MLYIYTGNGKNVRTEARALIELCKKKRPDALYEVFSSVRESQLTLGEIVYGTGLFAKKHIVFIDEPKNFDGEWRGVYDYLLEHASVIVASEHMFVLVESEIPPKELETFKKTGAVIHSKSEVVEETRPSFALAQALASKNRKEFFVTVHRMRLRGENIDACVPTLYWQLRMLLLAKNHSTAQDAGVKEYPFAQAKKYAPLWSSSELLSVHIAIDEAERLERMKRLSFVDMFDYIMLSIPVARV
ncbi:MAG: hypothetical protein QM526_00340 [Alphaproteobacteria bacterium]|nr:hypothetical protein [Alphaproteobacteria bacterium]